MVTNLDQACPKCDSRRTFLSSHKTPQGGTLYRGICWTCGYLSEEKATRAEVEHDFNNATRSETRYRFYIENALVFARQIVANLEALQAEEAPDWNDVGLAADLYEQLGEAFSIFPDEVEP